MYTLSKVLGKGQFGTTRVAEEKATGKILACKSIAKIKLKCVIFSDSAFLGILMQRPHHDVAEK